MFPTGHIPSNRIRGSGLRASRHGSQYALQQLQRHVDVQPLLNCRNYSSKHCQHSCNGISGETNRRSSATNSMCAIKTVRRRVSRACDLCHQSRVRCNGQHPCAHCVEFNLTCEYIRVQKKRGKASHKDLARQAAVAAVEAAAAAANNGQKSLTDKSSDGRSPSESRPENGYSAGSPRPEPRSLILNDTVGLNKTVNGNRQRLSKTSIAESLGSLPEALHQHRPLWTGQRDNMMTQDQVVSSADIELNGNGSIYSYRPTMNSYLLYNEQLIDCGTPSSLPGYGDLPHSIQSCPNYPVTSQLPSTIRLGDSDLPEFPMDLSGPTLGWISMQAPITEYRMTNQHTFNSPSRYAILQPLITHLGDIMPVSSSGLEPAQAGSSAGTATTQQGADIAAKNEKCG